MLHAWSRFAHEGTAIPEALPINVLGGPEGVLVTRPYKRTVEPAAWDAAWRQIHDPVDWNDLADELW